MTQRRSLQSQSISSKTAAINECVRYILYREGSKIPIKRADITKHLSTTCEMQKNEVDSIIAGAENVLKKVYGYCLAKDAAQYIVVLNEPCEDVLLSPLVEPKEYALLNAALTHIFMSGGSVKEGDMWNFLIKAGLMKENDNTVSKLFTKKFTKQLYLTCTKTDGIMSTTSFQWGLRAHKEASKMFILQKVAEAMGKEPAFWTEQYNEATGKTGPVANSSRDNMQGVA